MIRGLNLVLANREVMYMDKVYPGDFIWSFCIAIE